jgi:hypothetical protein
MPGDEVIELRQAIDDQTIALSGEFNMSIDALRDAMSDGFRGVGERVEKNTARLVGDSERPGVIAELKELQEAQEGDDDREKARAVIRSIVKWGGPPLAAIVFSVGGWVASQAWHDHVAIGDNGHAIERVKTRLEHVEELRQQADDNHRALLRALRTGERE